MNVPLLYSEKLDEPTFDITFCDVLPILESFKKDADVITVDNVSLFRFYKNKVDIYLLDVVLDCNHDFIQGCLKDDYLVKWHTKLMSEAEGFTEWLISRLQVDFESSVIVNEYLKAKSNENESQEISVISTDTMRSELSTFMVDRQNSALLSYHTDFEKLL